MSWDYDHGDSPHEVEDVRVVAETAAAIQVERSDGGRLWVPKSVLHDDSEVTGLDDEGTLVVKTWWAEKEGL